MQDNRKVDQEWHPFTNRSVRDHRTARERLEAQPKAFDAIDVPRLWQHAEADRDLYSLIQIGAHTAMRREEICALKVSQVRTDIATGIRYLLEVGDKTESAIRNVPIPSAIATLIDELVANATADDYLIHDGTIDQFGFRGGGVGGRFSDLKAAMGFGSQYQFRSLRKTAIRCMKVQRKVVGLEFYESIVKNIVGHKDKDITSGRYAGVSGLADKLLVIETIGYPV
jgi:integrase